MDSEQAMELVQSSVTPPDELPREVDLNGELFQRAYFAHDGPFSRVIKRLEKGYSVLVYLPGNCMTAAATVVKSHIQGYNWAEYGEHLGGEQPISHFWLQSGGFASLWQSWFTSRQGRQPGAIFRNLDFLTDWQGSVHHHIEAQTAVACLTGGIRSSVVLGLSDRDAGPLPSAIARAFNEEEWLNEIPLANFGELIPGTLRDKLSIRGRLPAGVVWLLASRLRWSDPLRAYQIMNGVETHHSSLESILNEILKATQTVNFLAPDEVYAGKRPRGFATTTMDLLDDNIIEPFRQWKSFNGTMEACQTVMRRLPPGLILFGPPGTGKTTLARWIARETGLPVRTVSGSDIKAGGWGEAEKNVRNLFRDARRAVPCVLVLDDADDLLPDRNTAEGTVASAERAVVNEFLQQLQGVRGRLEGVLVILTTNRFANLDQAAKERLALHLRIPYPSEEQIGEIVDALAAELDFDLSRIRDRLIERFKHPIAPSRTLGRFSANSNYFSPREMQNAMRLLEGWQDHHRIGEPYTPTLDDLERLERHYKQLGMTHTQIDSHTE